MSKYTIPNQWIVWSLTLLTLWGCSGGQVQEGSTHSDQAAKVDAIKDALKPSSDELNILLSRVDLNADQEIPIEVSQFRFMSDAALELINLTKIKFEPSVAGAELISENLAAFTGFSIVVKLTDPGQCGQFRLQGTPGQQVDKFVMVLCPGSILAGHNSDAQVVIVTGSQAHPINRVEEQVVNKDVPTDSDPIAEVAVPHVPPIVPSETSAQTLDRQPLAEAGSYPMPGQVSATPMVSAVASATRTASSETVAPASEAVAPVVANTPVSATPTPTPTPTPVPTPTPTPLPDKFIQMPISTSDEEAHAVAVSPTGNVCTTGLARNNNSLPTVFIVCFGPGPQNTRLFAPKWVIGTSASQFSSYGEGIVFDPVDPNFFYVTGSTDEKDPLNHTRDAFLAKFDLQGNQVWSRLIASNEYEIGMGVATDTAGNVYVGGSTNGNLDGTGPADMKDAFVAKYDSNGTKIWLKQMRTTDEGTAILVNGSSVYVVGGKIPRGGLEMLAAKLNTADGSIVWEKTFPQGIGSSISRGIALDSTGNVYIVGEASNIVGAASGSDGVLIKLDPNGGLVWTKQMGSPQGDWLTGVTVTNLGGTQEYVVIEGYTGGKIGAAADTQLDIFYQTYSLDGTLLKTHQFNEPTGSQDLGYGIAAGPQQIHLVGRSTGKWVGTYTPASRDFLMINFIP